MANGSVHRASMYVKASFHLSVYLTHDHPFKTITCDFFFFLQKLLCDKLEEQLQNLDVALKKKERAERR